MEKRKEYDWRETNLALFGSDIEKKIKAASADGEKAWDGVGQKPELRIWRIEQFKVVKWPRSRYGEFFDGDSYIVLHTYKKRPDSDALAFDIHFWIGKFSTQDEYCTAAYKTVELDHKLQDMAIQHREVMEHESRAFLDLFKSTGIKYLEGGVESGFNIVEEEVHEPRLYQIKGVKGALVLRQIKLRRDKLNSGDVFVLDLFDTVYQWNGKESNAHEKLQAKELVSRMISNRGGKGKSITLDEDQGDAEVEEFWSHIPGERKFLGITVRTYNVKGELEGGEDEKVVPYRKSLFRLTDKSGDLKFSRRSRESKSSRKINRRYLDSKDAFVLDDGFTVWVWVGNGASSKERGQAFAYAMKYLKDKKRPDCMPITRVVEDNEPPSFMEHFEEKKMMCFPYF